MVLASDGAQSFVIYNYASDEMQWSQESMSYVLVGLSDGQGYHLMLEDDTLHELDNMSNIGIIPVAITYPT